MPREALELLLDPTSDASVRALWDRLRHAGLPSQADHRGATNAPHVTLVEVDVVGHTTVAAAARLDAPVDLVLRGPVVWDQGPLVLEVQASASLRDAVEAMREAEGETRPWRPHVTLARRAGEAGERMLDLLGLVRIEARAGVVRHWDPGAQVVTELVDLSRDG